MKIIIVDDNETFRENLKYYIEEFLFFEVIGEAANGESVLALNNIHLADIILMDIEMPILNGIKATKQILFRNKYAKIIAITNYEEKAYLIELISAGFKACVFKNNLNNEIAIAIEKVMNGELHFPKDINMS